MQMTVNDRNALPYPV